MSYDFKSTSYEFKSMSYEFKSARYESNQVRTWLQSWYEKKVKYLFNCYFCHCNNLGDLMARVYTEQILRVLNKNQITDLFLKKQEQTNTTIASLTAEIKRLNKNCQKLESDVSVIKNVTNILPNQMSSIERQCCKKVRYSRHECVWVVGLPSSIEDKELEPTVCRVFQHIGVDITGERIEACHHLKKQSVRTIVKFSRRKDSEHVMRRKSELRKLKSSDLDLPNGTKLYINESLCSYYRFLWNKCKKLWNKQGIFSFFTINGSIRIKIRENGPYNIIHIDDFKDILPDQDFTMS